MVRAVHITRLVCVIHMSRIVRLVSVVHLLCLLCMVHAVHVVHIVHMVRMVGVGHMVHVVHKRPECQKHQVFYSKSLGIFAQGNFININKL